MERKQRNKNKHTGQEEHAAGLTGGHTLRTHRVGFAVSQGSRRKSLAHKLKTDGFQKL